MLEQIILKYFWKIRRDILSKFKTLPILGDYLHRDCYDAAKKYIELHGN